MRARRTLGRGADLGSQSDGTERNPTTPINAPVAQSPKPINQHGPLPVQTPIQEPTLSSLLNWRLRLAGGRPNQWLATTFYPCPARMSADAHENGFASSDSSKPGTGGPI